MDRSQRATAVAGLLLAGVLVVAGVVGGRSGERPGELASTSPVAEAPAALIDAPGAPRSASTTTTTEQIDALIAAVDAVGTAADAVTDAHVAAAAAEAAALAAADGQGGGSGGGGGATGGEWGPGTLPTIGVRTLPVYASTALDYSDSGVCTFGEILHTANVRWDTTDTFGTTISQPWMAMVSMTSMFDIDAIVFYRLCW